MTPEFLEFTVAAGNDLVTPHPEWNFPGLVAGDRWCLCAARWLEAFHAGKAPPVVLEATHEKSLDVVPFELLKKHAVVLNCARGELVESGALAAALEAGDLAGYGADVLDEEPPPANHPLLRCRGTVLTPHIGSRTYESVVRQAMMAAQNMINVLEGRPAVAQANKF
jgi:hypothetical protein